MKTTLNEVGDRCLAWALAEDLGGEEPPDLVAEVRARAATGLWPDEKEPAAPASWRIAAWMAAGIAVAVGTAWLDQAHDTRLPEAQRGVPAALPQDPQPDKAPPVTQDAPWVVVNTPAEL